MNKDIDIIDSLINKEDSITLASFSKEMEDVFNNSQTGRTRTEMEVSVLNDLHFPTSASKYWQSVREQAGMFRNITSLSFRYRKEIVKIKMLEQRLKNETDELKYDLLEIKIEEKQFGLKSMKNSARAIIRELKDWSEIKERESFSMNLGELKDADNHQLVSYTIRWVNQSLNLGNATPGERNNLVGQMESGLKLCHKRGILETVLLNVPSQIAVNIRTNLGVI